MSGMLFKKDYMDKAKLAEMITFSSLLSDREKREFYDHYKLSGVLPALGNTLYGLGSWLQGDYLGGAICSSAMVGGLVVMTMGTTSSTQNSSQFNIGMGLMMSGMIFGWIEPGIFAAIRNNRIREALQYY
jgi:hypothetical protein